MNATEVNNLYEVVRSGENINDKNLLTKSFTLDLFGANDKCFVNDSEALKFLLEVREAYRGSIYAKNLINQSRSK